MKVYKLPLVIKGPDEEGEKLYLAEVPALPGCRAWGDTAAEALETLQSVATASLQSYQERGDHLPQEIERTLVEDVDQVSSEVSVAL